MCIILFTSVILSMTVINVITTFVWNVTSLYAQQQSKGARCLFSRPTEVVYRVADASDYLPIICVAIAADSFFHVVILLII